MEDKININGDRRRFLGAAAMTIAAAPFGAIDAGTFPSTDTMTSAPTHAAPAPSFSTLKQIDAGVLNVGYAEAGPSGGRPVVLLHGWPYDIHTCEFGRLDFAVNNAGVSPWTGNTVDCTLETWQRVLSVNLTGTWLGMKHQIPAILRNGRGGAIVNMTSVAALQVFEGYPVYSASKWGIVGVTKVAAREFAAQGIRVNAIAPGSIETPLFSTVVNSTPTSRADYEKQTPMRRIAKSEEVAAAAAWLCSDAASYVTGTVLPVDGGMTL